MPQHADEGRNADAARDKDEIPCVLMKRVRKPALWPSNSGQVPKLGVLDRAGEIAGLFNRG
ncbi:MAG TPA: hypothetical protein VJ731_11440 [Terriglobales bacterium]|nr:hypothetical protein [Terriglobales bacterium]